MASPGSYFLKESKLNKSPDGTPYHPKVFAFQTQYTMCAQYIWKASSLAIYLQGGEKRMDPLSCTICANSDVFRQKWRKTFIFIRLRWFICHFVQSLYITWFMRYSRKYKKKIFQFLQIWRVFIRVRLTLTVEFPPKTTNELYYSKLFETNLRPIWGQMS